MLRWLSWSAAALIVLLHLAACAPARADALDQQTQPASPAARAAFEQGRDAYDRGRFGEALEHFERAYALSPHPKLLYNIGRSADSDGQVERAVSAYSSYLSAFPTAENREFVEARLEKLRALERLRQAQVHELAPVQAPAAATAPAPSTSAVAPLPEQPALLAHAGPETRADRAPLWKQPWLWVAVGAVVAGGITATVLLTRDDEPARARADVHVMTLEVR